MTPPDYSEIADFPDGRTPEQYEGDYRALLGAVQKGEPPFEDELQAAPIVRRWSVKRLHDPETEALLGYPVFQIWGFFDAHPFLPSNELAHTSPVLQMDPAGRWARCASRVYRLEQPLTEH